MNFSFISLITCMSSAFCPTQPLYNMESISFEFWYIVCAYSKHFIQHTADVIEQFECIILVYLVVCAILPNADHGYYFIRLTESVRSSLSVEQTSFDACLYRPKSFHFVSLSTSMDELYKLVLAFSKSTKEISLQKISKTHLVEP